MRDDILASLRRILVTDLGIESHEDAVGVDVDLQILAGFDSYRFSELRALCERKFGIVIADEDFIPQNFTSLGRLAALIEQLLATQGSQAPDF